MRRCAEGDARAWEAFVARYGALLTALARRMLARSLGQADPADVEEVVAEVLLALVRRDRLLLRRYDPAFRVSTYLGVICRSEAGRFLRRRGRQRGGALPDDEGLPARPAPAPLERLVEAERAAAHGGLRAALEALPVRDRLLLTLRYLEDLDYRAIGAALGLSPESVGQLLHRAKARLAERLPGVRALLEP